MNNRLILIFICGIFSSPFVKGLVYQDSELDSIIIDDTAVLDSGDFELSDTEDSTTPLPEGYCTTSGGFPGNCVPSDVCYSYRSYLIGNEKNDFTTALQEILNSTEPCSNGDGLICCPNYTYRLPNKRPSVLPQFTRPPGSGRPSTTTSVPITSTASTTTSSPLPDKKRSCGSYAYNATHPLVVGGRYAGHGEFPWAVVLLKKGKAFCGGSLINPNFVLTAAHCVQGLRDTSSLRLNFGDHDLSTDSETHHESRGAAKILYNKGFSMNTLKNDIALIKLSSPVKYTSTIQPVCLNTEEIPFNKKADLAGFGKTSNRGTTSSKLRTVNMRIIPNDECKSQYQGTNAPQITNKMICAGEKVAGHLKDACNGDSGGPLTYAENHIARQIGIVSWGIGCGEKPGVYTNVAEFQDWIRKNSK